MDSKRITHVLFDVDGLLLDTEALYTEVTQEIVAPYGKTFDWDVKVKMMGRPPIQSSQILVDELELPITAEEYLQIAAERFAAAFPRANLMPGVEKVVRYFETNAIPMALATGSSAINYEQKISRHREFFKIFTHVVAGDDPEVKAGKPAPDVYLQAAQRFSPPSPNPGNVLVFEDAPNGIEAARAAGMWTVMVPDQRMDPQLCKNAHSVIKSLEDFNPTEWNLPPYK
ncbi:pseudouridine-5'-phosphatase-like isoform X2 [Oscarella lobularis]|uniref:pseudouridine-5'-phosphatase-like isoform X2 n=1 Tax=Oscarella lobularis TaxID=121494 RepID=UPI0033139CF4